jgi:hypothetical protein
MIVESTTSIDDEGTTFQGKELDRIDRCIIAGLDDGYTIRYCLTKTKHRKIEQH